MRSIAGITAFILSLLAFSATAEAAAESKVTIKSWVGPPIQVGGEGTWTGKVKSARDKCRVDRKVILFYKDPAGSKLKIGVDRSEAAGNAGEWTINQEQPDDGPYVAKLQKSEGCEKAKSKLFDYPEDNPPFRAAHPRAAKAEANVKIRKFTPPPILGTFTGTVKSDVKACEKEREVTVYRRAGEENVEVGSGSTARRGERWVWEVFGGESTRSRYFALAPPTAKCKRAESRIFLHPGEM